MPGSIRVFGCDLNLNFPRDGVDSKDQLLTILKGYLPQNGSDHNFTICVDAKRIPWELGDLPTSGFNILVTSHAVLLQTWKACTGTPMLHVMWPLHEPLLEPAPLQQIWSAGLQVHASDESAWFNTFAEEGTNESWLQSKLGHALNSNILSVECSMPAFGRESQDTLKALGRSLASLIEGPRAKWHGLRDDGRVRPYLLGGVSLGGLLMKQALVQLSTNQEYLKACQGMVYIAVPHLGSTLANLAVLARSVGKKPTPILQELTYASHALHKLDEDFLQIKGDIPVLGVAESRKTRLVYDSANTLMKFLSKSIIVQVVSTEDAHLHATVFGHADDDHRGASKFKLFGGGVPYDLVEEFCKAAEQGCSTPVVKALVQETSQVTDTQAARVRVDSSWHSRIVECFQKFWAASFRVWAEGQSIVMWLTNNGSQSLQEWGEVILELLEELSPMAWQLMLHDSNSALYRTAGDVDWTCLSKLEHNRLFGKLWHVTVETNEDTKSGMVFEAAHHIQSHIKVCVSSPSSTCIGPKSSQEFLLLEAMEDAKVQCYQGSRVPGIALIPLPPAQQAELPAWLTQAGHLVHLPQDFDRHLGMLVEAVWENAAASPFFVDACEPPDNEADHHDADILNWDKVALFSKFLSGSSAQGTDSDADKDLTVSHKEDLRLFGVRWKHLKVFLVMIWCLCFVGMAIVVANKAQSVGNPVNCSVDTPVDSQYSTSYMQKQCSDGYGGPLCSMCITDGPCGRISTWAYRKGKSNLAIFATFIASTLLVLSFLYYSIRSTLKDNEEQIANTGSSKVDLASELERALMLWLQYIGMLSVPASISWRSLATQILSVWIVAATATCMYYINTNNTGIQVAGILVLLVMAILIPRAGSASARALLQKVWHKTKLMSARLCGCCARQRSTVYETSEGVYS